MNIQTEESKLILLLSTIVGAFIIGSNGSWSNFFLFITVMLIYIFVCDIEFIYQKFGDSCKNEDLLVKYTLWILGGEVCLAVFIFTTKLLIIWFSVDHYMAQIISFSGVFVVYETIKVIDFIVHQFSTSARKFKNRAHACLYDFYKIFSLI